MKILAILATLIGLNAEAVLVKPHIRKNGQAVKPYYRTLKVKKPLVIKPRLKYTR